MTKSTHRRIAAAAALAGAALIAAGCSTDTAGDAASSTTVTADSLVTSAAESASPTSATAPADEVTLTGVQGREVVLSGPIAAKYNAATQQQRDDLGKPLDGDHNAGTRDSGVVYQQFSGGVIVAENADPGTPAYITWGKIRDAWNIERTPDGTPTRSGDGKNGSAGPLGVPTSDETVDGSVRTTTFQHGTISYDAKTRVVTVVVNGKEVPSGL